MIIQIALMNAYVAELALKDAARLYLMYVKNECVSDYGGLKFDAEFDHNSFGNGYRDGTKN